MFARAAKHPEFLSEIVVDRAYAGRHQPANLVCEIVDGRSAMRERHNRQFVDGNIGDERAAVQPEEFGQFRP